MATMGVTCMTTAKGKIERSIHFDCANSSARPTPPMTAASRPSAVIVNVTSSDWASVSQSLTSVVKIRLGAGRI